MKEFGLNAVVYALDNTDLTDVEILETIRGMMEREEKTQAGKIRSKAKRDKWPQAKLDKYLALNHKTFAWSKENQDQVNNLLEKAVAAYHRNNQ